MDPLRPPIGWPFVDSDGFTMYALKYMFRTSTIIVLFIFSPKKKPSPSIIPSEGSKVKAFLINLRCRRTQTHYLHDYQTF